MADFDSSDFDGSQRVDIAIHENGIAATIRKIHQAAAAVAVLSPEAAMSLRGEALRLGEHLESVVKGAAKVVLQTAVQVTPVDTGMARANWQIAVGKGRYRAYEVIGTDKDGVETIMAGTQEIENADRKPGESYFVYNAAHHIVALENGWSAQAPAGMTALARQAGEQWAHNKRIALRGKL
jgi:hypothetical protein